MTKIVCSCVCVCAIEFWNENRLDRAHHGMVWQQVIAVVASSWIFLGNFSLSSTMAARHNRICMCSKHFFLFTNAHTTAHFNNNNNNHFSGNQMTLSELMLCAYVWQFSQSDSYSVSQPASHRFILVFIHF